MEMGTSRTGSVEKGFAFGSGADVGGEGGEGGNGVPTGMRNGREGGEEEAAGKGTATKEVEVMGGGRERVAAWRVDWKFGPFFFG